jgi:hypothetical protein
MHGVIFYQSKRVSDSELSLVFQLTLHWKERTIFDEGSIKIGQFETPRKGID